MDTQLKKGLLQQTNNRKQELRAMEEFLPHKNG